MGVHFNEAKNKKYCPSNFLHRQGLPRRRKMQVQGANKEEATGGNKKESLKNREKRKGYRGFSRQKNWIDSDRYQRNYLSWKVVPRDV